MANVILVLLEYLPWFLGKGLNEAARDKKPYSGPILRSEGVSEIPSEHWSQSRERMGSCEVSTLRSYMTTIDAWAIGNSQVF